MAVMGHRGDGAVSRLGTHILQGGDKSQGDNTGVLPSDLCIKHLTSLHTARPNPTHTHPAIARQCTAIHGWPENTETGGEGNTPILPCAEVLLQMVLFAT